MELLEAKIEKLEANIEKIESQMQIMQLNLSVLNELTKQLLEKLEGEEDATCEEE